VSIPIDSYRFGQIVVNGQAHHKDVIILPDRVVGGWWRKEGHLLSLDDLQAVIEAAPEVLVVGQGQTGAASGEHRADRPAHRAGRRDIQSPARRARRRRRAAFDLLIAHQSSGNWPAGGDRFRAATPSSRTGRPRCHARFSNTSAAR
jgi:hypothetical protein